MIVGYDPGASRQGIVIIDFWGRLLFSATVTGGLSEAIEIVKQFGRPAIVAGDRKHIDAVKKLAATFGAVVFFPGENLKVRDKLSLTRGYDVGSIHERDALASALIAFKSYKKLIEKLRKREVDIFVGLLKGKYPNLKVAIERTEGEKKKRERKKIDEEKAILYKKIAELKAKIAELERLLRETRKKAARKTETKKVIIERVVDEKILAEKEILKEKVRVFNKKLEAALKENKKLRAEIEMLKKMIRKLESQKEASGKEKSEDILELIENYKERFKW